MGICSSSCLVLTAHLCSYGSKTLSETSWSSSSSSSNFNSVRVGGFHCFARGVGGWVGSEIKSLWDTRSLQLACSNYSQHLTLVVPESYEHTRDSTLSTLCRSFNFKPPHGLSRSFFLLGILCPGSFNLAPFIHRGFTLAFLNSVPTKSFWYENISVMSLFRGVLGFLCCCLLLCRGGPSAKAICL